MNRSWKRDGLREMSKQQRESQTTEEREAAGEAASRQIEDTMRGAADKIRENRLRRAAERQGLLLQKSRRRDPRAVDFGTYMLVDANTNAVVASGLQSGYGLSLDEIEEELSEGRRP